MSAKQGQWRGGAILAAALLLALAVFSAPPGWAAEEASLFYEELAPHGDWVDYGDYGPVWHPTKVSPNWRPYLDGRWVPTTEGWVFETSEPWGWATYHFGNWMPTEEFGWVWAPGSTWYPATTAWRTAGDFVGWAPIPPPDFTPPPAFAPAGGFVAGTGGLDLLTPPFWSFAHAPNFLLGFGQPFSPAFSFFNCGCLAPFNFVPAIFPRSVLLRDFFFPRFAPNAFFAFGPPFSGVALFSNVDLLRLNKFARTVDLLALQNVLPPAAVFSRRPFLRNAFPAAVLQGQRFQVRPAPDAQVAARRLAYPGVVAPPPNMPRLRGEIPKAAAAASAAREKPLPEVIRGMQVSKGLGLPPQAELEQRVLRPEVRQEPRRERVRPGGASGAGVAGEPGGRRREAGGVSGRGRLTPREENLKTQMDVEILRQQILQSRRGRQESRPAGVPELGAQPRREIRLQPQPGGAPPARGRGTGHFGTR
jgi:hypothetical protein